MRIALSLLFVVAVAYAATVEKFAIDDFTVGANSHQVSLTLSSDVTSGGSPVSSSSSFNLNGCSGLIGCARDMKVTVNIGTSGRTCTSNIFSVNDNPEYQGEWGISNPKNFNSVTFLQYDGNDGSSDLTVTGLGGVDFSDGGLSTGITFSATVDITTTLTIDLYSTNGQLCTQTVTISSSGTSYSAPYSGFSGSCDQSRIGAVVLTIPSIDAVDILVHNVFVVGEVASVSPSPSRAVAPSSSNTPSPTRTPPASASHSPSPTSIPSSSRTPTPTPSADCLCHCPIFTCALIFDPDDDQNDAYYFDDDDVEARGLVRVPAVDVAAQDSTGNNASLLQVSVAVVLMTVAFTF